MRDRRVPDAQAVAAAAQIAADNIEAEERESIIVIDAGDRRRRRAVELADEKAVGIDGIEAFGIGEAGIPAFRRRPIDGDGNFVGPHGANAQPSCASHRGCRA
jgi:hypothetical protein